MRFLRAVVLYLRLLLHTVGFAGRLEVTRAILRAVFSRLRTGRGALHVRQPVTIMSQGVRWYVPPFDNSFASTSPGHDNHDVIPAIRRELATRSQPVCLDIGANLGFVCLALAREFPGRRFIGVEPIPWLAGAIERSVKLNGYGNVVVVARAIAEGRQFELAVPVVDGVRFTTLSSGAATASLEAAGRANEMLVVPAITLDALLELCRIAPEDIACVKIDVEGFEAQALATGGRALSARPPVLFEALTSAQREAAEAVLRGMGYSRFELLDGHNIVAREA